ncbi:MAG: hypothetical protein QOI54_3733, partial [Actinomycetota bacterium]|nr:hypothetical protein [Actinomycetota bacterium]
IHRTHHLRHPHPTHLHQPPVPIANSNTDSSDATPASNSPTSRAADQPAGGTDRRCAVLSP